ncbi:MAG: hypothetical protein WC531_01110 [Candidatus Paceibacterota bacterium]|jgi:hypothetical protein
METNTLATGPIKISEVLNTLDYFKQGVNLMLLKRRYFIDKVLPILQEGHDYYVIMGKKVLSKGGGERIAQIYGFTSRFELDRETLSSFSDAKNLVALKCVLYRPDGSVAGEGRGCASLAKNGNDENKTIKLAEKSAFLSAIIRSANISAYFTMDLDEKPEFRNQVVQTEAVESVKPLDEPLMATERQKSYLESLIYDQITDENAREEALNSLQTATRYDASQMIAGLVGVR